MNVKDAIETRRAYRALAPVEISDGTVRDLAEAARLSASCFNNQPWRFVFVRKPDVLEQMFGTLSYGNAWARASSMIVAVLSRADLDCQIKEREYFLFDTGMATALMILRATELGLVAHPIAGYSPKKVRGVLGVPDDMHVATLVMFGKHTDEISDLLSEDQAAGESKRPERHPFEEFAWMDEYGEGCAAEAGPKAGCPVQPVGREVLRLTPHRSCGSVSSTMTNRPCPSRSGVTSSTEETK